VSFRHACREAQPVIAFMAVFGVSVMVGSPLLNDQETVRYRFLIDSSAGIRPVP